MVGIKWFKYMNRRGSSAWRMDLLYITTKHRTTRNGLKYHIMIIIIIVIIMMMMIMMIICKGFPDSESSLQMATQVSAFISFLVT